MQHSQTVLGSIRRMNRKPLEGEKYQGVDLSPLSLSSIIATIRWDLLQRYPVLSDVSLSEVVSAEVFARALVVYESRLNAQKFALDSFEKIGGTD